MADGGILILPEAQNWPASDEELLAAVALHLREHVRLGPEPEVVPIDLDHLLAEFDVAPRTALSHLTRAFALTRAEAGFVVALAAISYDAALAASCTAIQGLPRSGAVSYAFAGRLIPELGLESLSPDAAVRFWKLVAPDGANEAASVVAYRLDERVLYRLTGGVLAPDYLQSLDTGSWLAPSELALAGRIAKLIDPADSRTGLIVELSGEDPECLRAIAASVGEKLGAAALAIAARSLPSAQSDLTEFARLCSRDVALAEAILLIDATDCEAEVMRVIPAFAAQVQAPVLIATCKTTRLPGRTALRIDVPSLDLGERRLHWQSLAPWLRGDDLAKVSRTFMLGSADRTAAVRRLGEARSPEQLWTACREQSRDQLEGLAEHIVSSVGWEDLVLPESQSELLHDIVDHVELAGTVFEDWQLGNRQGRGTGVAALFAGPSGTGKTLAAEVLANALKRDVYRIDLSQVVSKYIGETEKNLAKIFAAAEAGGAILLFDEADALFGKRSEVQDAHDRYANIEVSYLLQRMESYCGLSILTTNLRDALDKAFLRRLRFIVQFAYPNAEQRTRIWERAFPAELPTKELDFARLAQLDLTGGAIRNVALAAAFRAARSGGPLTMDHCIAAAMREYQKLEKPLGGRELGRGR